MYIAHDLSSYKGYWTMPCALCQYWGRQAAVLGQTGSSTGADRQQYWGSLVPRNLATGGGGEGNVTCWLDQKGSIVNGNVDTLADVCYIFFYTTSCCKLIIWYI